MANLSGTIVAAPVRPTSDVDTYATAFSNEINGGHHSVLNTTEMINIPAPRRAIGMFCYVDADKKVYQLINNPSTDTTQMSDWEVFSSGDVESIEVETGVSLKKKLEAIDAALYNKFGVFIIADANKAGMSEVELTIPFKASLKSLSMSLPSDATVTSAVTVKVYYSNSTTASLQDGMALFGTVTIDSVDGVVFKAEDPVDVEVEANTRLRCEMVDVQSDIKNIQVTVQMKMV